MSYEDYFKVEKKEHVTWLILNRPEKRNAMNPEFFHGLIHYFKAFDEDPETRVVIIKGEGKSFTTGMDLNVFSQTESLQGAYGREQIRKYVLKHQEGFNAIEKCRKPVIAAIHGHCIGGGIDLISACDIRLAAKDTLFSVRETRVAIVADLGTLQRLPHIIGQGWFRELALTGRDFTSELALKIGLITHVCEDQKELMEKSSEIAAEIESLSPLIVQASKDCMNFNRDNGVYPGLDYVAQKASAIFLNEDLEEAMNAFMEKRKPRYGAK